MRYIGVLCDYHFLSFSDTFTFVNKYLKNDTVIKRFVYDAHYAKTGTYVDMVKAGIIDPVKVVRTALVDAAR
jgi:chaperonin GroEL (HSP60 family)